MGEEEREQSEDEKCEAGRDEVDEGDGEKQGDDGDGEEEGCVRRLVSQMREEWEDGVVYVGTTNGFNFAVTHQRNSGDVHKAHEVLDSLQIGLPNRGSFGRLRRGSRGYGVPGMLATIGWLSWIRSKENRDEEGVGNEESQPREEALRVSQVSSSINQTCPEKRG
jgi:hypothetical protein